MTVRFNVRFRLRNYFSYSTHKDNPGSFRMSTTTNNNFAVPEWKVSVCRTLGAINKEHDISADSFLNMRVGLRTSISYSTQNDNPKSF